MSSISMNRVLHENWPLWVLKDVSNFITSYNVIKYSGITFINVLLTLESPLLHKCVFCTNALISLFNKLTFPSNIIFHYHRMKVLNGVFHWFYKIFHSILQFFPWNLKCFYFSPFSPFAFSQHFFTFSGFTRNQGDSQEVPIYRVKYYRYECIYICLFL